ncbi:hypothetical protein Sjap_012664 [Stephania japonica]|uniref:Uncharacterized protein n=1 Tax=Stephania japonica TaxID=461633 RepID=A0AAP0IYE5_9MAGN
MGTHKSWCVARVLVPHDRLPSKMPHHMIYNIAIISRSGNSRNIHDHQQTCLILVELSALISLVGRTMLLLSCGYRSRSIGSTIVAVGTPTTLGEAVIHHDQSEESINHMSFPYWPTNIHTYKVRMFYVDHITDPDTGLALMILVDCILEGSKNRGIETGGENEREREIKDDVIEIKEHNGLVTRFFEPIWVCLVIARDKFCVDRVGVGRPSCGLALAPVAICWKNGLLQRSSVSSPFPTYRAVI